MTATPMTASPVRRAARGTALCCVAAGGAGSAHLLTLLGAATTAARKPPPARRDDLALAVVIPAHDEEAQIAGTVRSVQACDYEGRRRIVVVADNCRDATAAAARAAGAEVWKRTDPLRRGKGHALAWAFARLLEDVSVQVVCVVDADCEVSRNFCAAVATRIHAGSDAVQVPYLVSNPEHSPAAALRWAGFALFNVVRPLGRDRLRLSSGLLGTGMAFSRELLLRSPWAAFSFAEDREQHMRWVLEGARVTFAPEAEVRSPAAGTPGGARAQERRWESGRGRLATQLTPRLLARSVRTRNFAGLDAALEPVLPPQSLLLAVNLGGMAAARLLAPRGLFRIAAGAVLGQIVYVVGGLALVRAPASVWRAFASLPRFLARRMTILLSAGAGPSAWERTPRDAHTGDEPAREISG